jgi:hypothetical protein
LTLKAELPNYDGVVSSTFFSHGERACLKTLLAGASRIVWVLPMVMPEKIPLAWTDAFLTERALWLSAFDEPKATRTNCRRANEWVERFCVEGSRHARMSSNEGSRHGEKEQCGGKKERVWAPNYWDVICFDPEMLEIREKYVRANPRRWALKGVPCGRVKQSSYVGNVDLLAAAGERRVLRVSRKSSAADIVALQDELTSFEGVVCSTFFSPGERECLKTVLSGSASVVWLLPMAIPESIPAAWTDAFLEKRALWLSAFTEPEASRASCKQANEWVRVFCADYRHGEKER